MKDQHKLIKGYRDLNEDEIDLINRVKEHAEKTDNLLQELAKYRDSMQSQMAPLSINQYQESKRCLAIAKTKLQTGQMWFVRAIALPESF